MRETCCVCKTRLDGDAGDRFVLVRGVVRELHCSAACLRRSLRRQQRERARVRRTMLLSVTLVALVVGGGGSVWLRFHAPKPRSISYAWPEDSAFAEPVPAAGPIFFGPAWPPTDDDWTYAFARASWIYPLPGPVKRAPTVDARVFGPEAPRDRPASCRKSGACGVDLGGELWGEHVYAALDGVVDRVHREGNEEHGGIYVRLSHFGGMVFTQYFHLAAIPRLLNRGDHVKAGQVIGLLGDTGTRGGRRHLHFALSTRPSAELAEVYWDPTQMMAGWPLRRPPNGTVAGLAP
jgi:murein DD-endopeptidase MepM/ murein hydrolase activator NlpD